VVRGAAREDHDPAQVLDLLVGEPEALELELRAGPDAVADRLAHRVGLLVDLLEHEGLVPALLGLLVVPLDRLDLLVLDRTVGVEEARTFRRDLDDLAVLDQLDAARLVEERRRRGREKHLALADADHERALVPCADQHVGVVVVDHDERVVTFELGVRRAHCLQEVAVVVALDEVRDDFGVGLGVDLVPFLLEGRPELAVVLDDPVQHDRDLAAGAAGQRMRVLLGDRAVRGPAGVAETVVRDRAVRAGGVDQVLQVADRAHVVECVVLAQRNARGVVPAVLEPLEALQKERLGLTASDISDDPAHLVPRSNAVLPDEMNLETQKPGCMAGFPR
jgi:hypothetical protein